MPKHHKRKQHRAVTLNRMEIPLMVQRDVILENDTVYCENLSALCRRIMSGKIPKDSFRRIQPWLVQAALRRAHVPLKKSLELMAA